MGSRSKKLYKDSPKMERGEDGKMGVKKPTQADAVQSGTDGVNVTNGVPMQARHSMDRHSMHGKHEAEHSMHDHGKGGDKAEMHDRHEKEMKDMHKRHEKEMSGVAKNDTDKKESTGEKMIEKTETKKKED